MRSLQPLVPLGQLAAVGSVVPRVVLVLVLVNSATRFLGHQSHIRQVKRSGKGTISRYLLHTITSDALVVASFFFLAVEPHGDMVLSILVTGMFVVDFFELETRKIEVRTDKLLERPNDSLVAAGFVFLYAGLRSLLSLVSSY